MKCDEKIMNRLKRAEGQMRGIQKMMTEEKECEAILTQLSAVRSSIDSIMGIMASENIRDCFENPAADPAVQKEKIQKAMKMIQKL